MTNMEDASVRVGETQDTDPVVRDETPAILVERVTKRFGAGTVAVNDISFTVGKSEFFSLLGPSGCGKTTTLRMLAGFETPTSGRISIDGRDAATLPVHKRNTNLVFQNYALFPHMTIQQNVAFGPERKRLPRREVQERVAEVLDAVRLRDYAARYPRELSGGQQQRVALARALANRPAVLLLDEPLGALDLKLRENMQFELKRIQREVGISFVYVTHDQGEALTMSDRIAVMNRGKIEHLGGPEEVYLRPKTLFTAGFIGQANLLPGKIETQDPSGLGVRLTDGSLLRAETAADGCAVGGNAMLMIRPEHLRLELDRPAADEPSIPVRLQDETFQGSWARYAAETREGTRMVLLVPSDARPGARAFDREVWVSCKAEHAYALPRDEESDDAEAASEELTPSA
jgi:spermidine/putrescine transport system ATP-binding protein